MNELPRAEAFGDVAVISGEYTSGLAGLLLHVIEKGGKRTPLWVRPVARAMTSAADAHEARKRRTSGSGSARARDIGSVSNEARESNIMTTAEVAAMLGRSPRRVRQLVDARELAGRRIGSQWVLERADVERYLETHT